MSREEERFPRAVPQADCGGGGGGRGGGRLGGDPRSQDSSGNCSVFVYQPSRRVEMALPDLKAPGVRRGPGRLGKHSRDSLAVQVEGGCRGSLKQAGTERRSTGACQWPGPWEGHTLPARTGCVHACSVTSVVSDSATLLTAVFHQAPQSLGFSRPECWSGLPCPSPGKLPTSGIEPHLLHCRWILYPLSHLGSPTIQCPEM